MVKDLFPILQEDAETQKTNKYSILSKKIPYNGGLGKLIR
jgi:hypothetical protein